VIDKTNRPSQAAQSTVPPGDEGGLRAPPGLTGWRKAWWWFDFIALVNFARLRFVAILVVIGAVITQWDSLAAYYDKWTRPANAAAGGSGDVEWFCPMHPAVIRDNGKEKCPVCFMPLSKRKKGEAHEEVLPAGIVNRLQLSPYRMVLAGVQTWKLDYQPVSKKLDAVGFVEFNERGQKTVAARIAGRIEKLFVNETGQQVDSGQLLASIYSPDLVVTVQNLLDAKRTGASKNQESAQRRLELLGIDDTQIQEILETGKERTDLMIRSPISGHVIKKYVREGQYVEQGTPLYDVADLSTVWIQAQVYEDDMEFLPFEQDHSSTSPRADSVEVTATTRTFPDEAFRGKLAFIYPHVDQNTRTVTIRCEVKNPGHKLRPGSTATVTLDIPPKSLPALVGAAAQDPQAMQMLEAGRVLAVPDMAVIDTGAQSIVYREASPGTFEGVHVKLGPKMSAADGAALYPVIEGLAPGDQIVATGSFLVDAETRLNPAAGSVYFGGSGSKNSSTASFVRPSTPEDRDAKLLAALEKMPPEERKIAEAQGFCPILQQNRLGSMGTPVKVMLEGKPVFLCCDGCKKAAQANPAKTLAKVAALVQGNRSGPPDVQSETTAEPDDAEEAKIAAALAKLSDKDRKIASEQKFCVVLEDNRLGTMGTPVKVMVEGHTVFLCCKGCKTQALADAKATLAKAAQLKAKAAKR
jgi:membrane fusion protein, copper/silver efflux system